MILVILLLELMSKGYELKISRKFVMLLIGIRLLEMAWFLIAEHETSFVSTTTFLGVPLPEYNLMRFIDTLFVLLILLFLGVPALVLLLIWFFLKVVVRYEFVQKLYFNVSMTYAHVKHSLKNIFKTKKK